MKEIYELLRTKDPALGIVLDCCRKISHDSAVRRLIGLTGV
jgi:hypothetical protein